MSEASSSARGQPVRSPQSTTVRHRRPSGERPPLPRALYRDDLVVLGAAVVVIALWLVVFALLDADSSLERLDRAGLDLLVEARSDLTVDAARSAARLAGTTFLTGATLAAAIGLIVLRRFRRLFVFLGTTAVATAIVTLLDLWLQEPRPFAVQILGDWAGYANPALGLTTLTAVLLGACFSYLPSGRLRRGGVIVTAVVVAAVSVSQVLLAVHQPSAGVMGVAIAAVVTVLGFRLLAPDTAFPVHYGKGRAAHLDLGGQRGEAIRLAIAAQLGLEVVAVEPFGLSGSAGSSPMRITVAGDPPVRLFAKLYAEQHVRADRWYKLGRALLYGRLEDEAPFRGVRRLVQNEDYLMRVFRDAGVPVVQTSGFVELTPEREYLLVTEFADEAHEISDPAVAVDDAVIDSGLGAIRALWDAGLAHRDVKPANLLVRDGRVLLIDVAFGQVRPTPWREAVDLANMMLCLALRTDAERVYERALRRFTPAEISEAFAAAHGVAVPTELRARLKADGRDLRARFRDLAPPQPTIPIQRWSLRRIGLIGGMAVLGVLGVVVFLALVRQEGGRAVGAPECPDSPSVLLFGQAVPAAAAVPCVVQLPVEWGIEDTEVIQDEASFRIDLRGGDDVTVRFVRACAAQPAVPPDDALPLDGLAAAAAWRQVEPDGASEAMLLGEVEGGCVEVRFAADVVGREGIERVGAALALVPRQELDAAVADRTNGEFDRLTIP